MKCCDISPADEDSGHFIHTDHLTSTGTVTASDGTWLRVHTYTPYGNSHVTVENPADPSATEADRFTFSGKERDDESDLMYFEARYLATDSARFTAQDPLFWDIGREDRLLDPQLANSYSYAKNNPAVYVDPDGRSPAAVLFRYGAPILAGVGVSLGFTAAQDAVTAGKTPAYEYGASATGGFVTGLTFSATRDVTTSGAVGGGVQSISESLYSGQPIDPVDVVASTVTSAVISNVKTPSIQGYNAGRNSLQSQWKQLNTKLDNGTIQSVSTTSVVESFVYNTVENSFGEAIQSSMDAVKNFTNNLFKKKDKE